LTVILHFYTKTPPKLAFTRLLFQIPWLCCDISRWQALCVSEGMGLSSYESIVTLHPAGKLGKLDAG
jgi:hypothetical protein